MLLGSGGFLAPRPGHERQSVPATSGRLPAGILQNVYVVLPSRLHLAATLGGRRAGAGRGLVRASVARTDDATASSNTLDVVSDRQNATIYSRYRPGGGSAWWARIAHGGGRIGQCLGPSQGRPDGLLAPARFHEASTTAAELGS